MVVLLPDACSLISLSDVFIGTHHITNLLTKTFAVKTTTEVVQEIQKQQDKIRPYETEVLHFVRSTQKVFQQEDEYENILFRHFAPEGNPEKSRGERTICALALYLVRNQLANQVVVLTDDKKAVNGLFKWFQQHFIAIDVWSSLDLLLYMYLATFPKWSLAKTKVALRTVNNRIGGQGQELSKRLSSYNKRIQATNTILRDLPIESSA